MRPELIKMLPTSESRRDKQIPLILIDRQIVLSIFYLKISD